MGGTNASRTQKRNFHGNKYTNAKKHTKRIELESRTSLTASATKLHKFDEFFLQDEDLKSEKIIGCRIIDMDLSINIFSMIYCPSCLTKKSKIEGRFQIWSVF